MPNVFDFNPTSINPFPYWKWNKVLPAVYDDSLSQYEILCKLLNVVNNIIDSTNSTGEQVEQLTQLVQQLIDGEFPSGIVQYVTDIVDAVIDDDISSINNIISSIQETLDNVVYRYDTINELISADIPVGAYAITKGFNQANDGGAAKYIIESSGTPDNIGTFTAVNGYAVIVVENEMSPLSFGATIGSDASSVIQYMVNNSIKINGNNKTFIIATPIVPITGEIFISNCIFDFNLVGNGFFTRAYPSIYNSDVSVISDKITFINCKFINAVDHINSSSSATSYDAALPLTAKNIFIDSCVFENNKCHGMMLYSNTYSTDIFSNVIIKNCKAINNGIFENNVRTKTGIGIGSYLDANSLETNVCVSECETSDNSNSGIAMHGIANVIYNNCFSHDNHEHGFVFQTNTSGCISNCIANSNGNKGIRIQGDWNISPVYCKNITVSNCVVNNSRAVGIGGNVENVVIENNIFNINSASIIAFEFDPRSYFDKNIIIRNNIINMSMSSYRVIDEPEVQDIYTFENNTINGVFYPYYGYVIGGVDGTMPYYLLGKAPKLLYAAYTELKNSLTASYGTYSNNILTSTSNAGNVRYDVDISTASKTLIVCVEATPLNMASTDGLGYIRANIRQSDGTYIADLALASAVQYATVANIMGTWCMMIDIEKLREVYPNAGIVRTTFTLGHNTDVAQIDSFKSLVI